MNMKARGQKRIARKLQAAIERTFRNRKMEIEATPIGLSAEFGNGPGKQTKRSAITQAPESLTNVVGELRTFFEPILGALV
jgi:hypothetical protein